MCLTNPANLFLRVFSLLGALALFLPVALAAAPEIEIADAAGTSLVSGSGSAPLGTMAIGGCKTLIFTVRNSGDAPLTGLQGSLIGADAADFVLTPPSDTEVAPGANANFSVSFIPGREGPHAAKVSLLSNDANESPFLINLTATGASEKLPIRVEEVGGAEMLSSGTPVDFGSPKLGESRTRTFKVTNLGTTAIRSFGMDVDDTYTYTPWYPWYTNSYYGYLSQRIYSGFSVSYTATSIPAGESIFFEVHWSPFETTIKNRNVVIATSNPANSPFKLAIVGAGSPYSPTPLELNGPHFRMGEYFGFHPSGPVWSEVRDTYPIERGSMFNRWTYTPPVFSADNTQTASTQPLDGVPASSYLRNYISIIQISYLTEVSFEVGDSAAPPPTFAEVTGPGSAAEFFGSTVGIHFQDGSYLKKPTRKLPGSDNVGMELWVRPESGTGRRCIALIGDEAAAGGFGLYLVDGVPQGQVGLQEVVGSAPLTVGAWHHLALVLDNGTATLYVNGTASGRPLSSVSLPALVKGLGVGATVSGADPFTGTVDEMRLFETSGGGFVPETQLLGTAKPHATVDKTTLDFGRVMLGAKGTQYFSLANQGPGWLAIRTAELIGEGAGDFAVVSITEGPLSPNGRPGSSVGSLNPIRPLEPARKLTFYIQQSPSVLGSRSAILRLTTNDPEHPTFDIALTGSGEVARPEIEVSTQEINWGTVLTSSSKVVGFHIVNQGSEPLTGLSWSVTGPHAEDVNISLHGPFIPVLPGGTLQSYNIQIFPKGTGARLATLRIVSNDDDENPVEIQLYGRGELPAPEIQVTGGKVGSGWTQVIADGGALDLGPVMRGREAGGQILISNVGTAELNGLDVTLDGPHAGDFTLTKELSALSPNSGVCQVIATFKPGGNGARTAVLHITSNDADESPYDITLTGTGLPEAPIMQVEDRGAITQSNRGFVPCGTAVIGGAAKTYTLQLRNTGPLPLTGFQTAFAGADATAFSATISPAVIAPEGVGNLVIAFQPAAIGPHAATLSLTSNATGSPFVIAVGGTGAYGERANLSVETVAGWVGTALVQLPNGNVLMAGYVETEGVKRARLREIRPDGTETGNFDHYGISNAIRALAVDATGRILITGNFSAISYPAGSMSGVGIFGQVFRFNADGSLDSSFTAPQGPQGPGFIGNAIVALPDGKILVGGQGTLGGRANLIRLNNDGSLDTTFTLAAPDAAVNALALQDDGKVLVGGDFTNYGQTAYTGPNLQLELVLWIGEIVTPLSGLFRLTTSGVVDPDFGNPGFHRVTALAVRGDRIAVGGEEKRWSYWVGIAFPIDRTTPFTNQSNIVIGDWPYWGNPELQSNSMARLINLSGGTFTSQGLSSPPNAIALQPGNRILVAPGPLAGDEGVARSSVELVRPFDQSQGHYGVRAAALEGTPLPQPGEYGNLELRYQKLGGPIHALLAQPDGKVLVAGDLEEARVAPFVSYAGIDSSGAWIGSPIDTQPLPAQTPLAGFAQLDIDGFYYPNPHVRGRSDGLNKQVFNTAVSFTSINLIGLSNEATVVGPNAADFEVQKTTIASNLHPGVLVEFFDVRFEPTGAGPRRATLKITKAGSDNPFEMGLEADAESDLPEGLIIVESDGPSELYPGDRADFGTLSVGKFKQKPFLLKNIGASPITTPVQVSITGEHASEFELAQTANTTLAAGASAPFKITFRPQAKGLRTAILRATLGTGLPFEARLEGQGVTVPTAVLNAPSHQIAAIGETVVFQVTPEEDQSTTCQWFRNGKAIPGATFTVLSLAPVTLAHAGAYTAEIKNAEGKALTAAARLAVIDGGVQRVTFGQDKTLTLAAAAEGEGLAFEWIKDGQLLPNNNRISNLRGKSLTIRNATVADAGIYTRRATLGTVQRSGGAMQAVFLPLPQLTAEVSYSWAVGREVTERLMATGEGGTWSLKGAPPGVKVDAITGQLSGKPTRAGIFTLEAKLSHPSGSAVIAVPVQVEALPLSLTGGFLALIERRAGFFQGRGGLVSLNITAQGTFTGSLTLSHTATQRSTIPFAGALTVTDQGRANADVSIKRSNGQPPLQLNLDFVDHELTVKIDGSYAGNGGAKLRGPSAASVRNLALSPTVPDANLRPAGFVRVVNSSGGAATIVGKVSTVAGTRSFTLSSHQLTLLNSTDNLPLYAGFSVAETLSGWLTLGEAGAHDDEGVVGWNAVAVSAQDVSLSFAGGVWLAPSSTQSLLGTGGQDNPLLLTFASGETQEVRLTSANRLVSAGGLTSWPFPQQGGLLSSLTVNPRTGAFSGWTWGLWSGARPLHWNGSALPFGKVEGLFIPGVGRAVGIYSNVEQPAANQAVLALPVTLELKE